MAAVAGHIDNFVAVVRKLAHTLGVMHVNALVEAVPGETKHAIGNTNRLVGEVGGDLFHQCDSILLGFLVRDFFSARLVFDGAGNRF